MAEDKNKQPKSYSLSPAVIAWITQKAARLTIENGDQSSQSELVNQILTDAMQADQRMHELADKVYKPQVRKVANTVTYHKHNISQEGK
jgi:hypothetical protein